MGFRVAERLAIDHSADIRRQEFLALTATIRIGRTKVFLMKPQTYMNRSGSSVEAACSALGVAPEQLVVVYDDADLALGRIRVRASGGTGGHRGLESIVDETGNRDFVRVRMGVGRPPDGVPLDQHVLAPVSGTDAIVIGNMIETAADAVCAIVEGGVVAAMQRFNSAAAAE